MILAPREVADSDVIGFSEFGAVARHNWVLFEVDRSNPEIRFYRKKGDNTPVALTDMVWHRCHRLIFANGKVIAHHVVDRPTGCILWTR